jgi:hypothetical protein
MFFAIPCILNPNLTTCASNPGAGEPTPVVIASDQSRKKGAMMQKANVGKVRPNDRQDGEKERVTVRSSFKVVV